MQDMKEGNVQAHGRMEASKAGAVTFRNNVGGAWSGKKVKKFQDGSIILKDPMWIKFGLVEGSGDTIGWKSITITPDMVGMTIAQFLSIEYKTATGRARDKQVKWHEVVSKAGGLSGFARNNDDVRRIIAGERIDP